MPKKIYFAIVAVVIAVAVWEPLPLTLVEAKIYDTYMQQTAPHKPDPRVVIVGIDQKSLDTLGRWPWGRDVIGRLVTRMAEFGTKVTALDVVFDTETEKELSAALAPLDTAMESLKDNKELDELYQQYAKLKEGMAKDQALADSIHNAGNVVTGYLFHSSSSEETSIDRETAKRKRESVEPFAIKVVSRTEDSGAAFVRYADWEIPGEVEPNIQIIQNAGAASGFLNAVEDRDAVFRRYPLVIESEGKLFMSMALATAALYKGEINNIAAYYYGGVFHGVSVGDSLFMTDMSGRTSPRYLGYDGTFPIISAADIIMAEPGDPKITKALNGKVAFVGATATQLYDLRQTPMGKFAGVEIHATMTANILSEQMIAKYEWQTILDVAMIIVVAIIMYTVLHRVGVVIGIFFSAAVMGGIVYTTYWVFQEQMIWLHTIMPSVMVLGALISINAHQYLAEQKSKKFIRTAFSRYLSPKVVEQIVRNPDLLKLGGEKRMMTAFFSDVAGFTTISEKLTPASLVTLLNEYLSEMSYIISGLDGTVDKYEGDAIIAFWGAPLPSENHAEDAVLAAVVQQRKLKEMRMIWREQGRDELKVRMGLNTGPMVVGNMGSKERMDYTMMGDSVNLAARLEGANKYYGTLILISENTYEHVRERFFCRELDMVRVQGKDTPIRLYEVVEEMDQITEPQRRQTLLFSLALATFRLMEFEKAAALFEAGDKMVKGGDQACKLYYKRCAQLIEAPPPDDWDRVYDIAK